MRLLFSALIAWGFMGTALAQKTIYDEFATRRSVESFSGIDASAGIEVLISHSDKEALAISTNVKEVESKIVTKVENGVLKIGVESGWKVWEIPKTWKVKVYVSYRHLTMLKASSGASIRGEVNATTLRSRQSSGGIVELEGKTNDLIVESSSGGIFKGYKFTAAVVDADVSSGGGVQVTAASEVNAKAHSGGFVSFKGNAVIKNIDVHSGGSVKRAKTQ